MGTYTGEYLEVIHAIPCIVASAEEGDQLVVLAEYGGKTDTTTNKTLKQGVHIYIGIQCIFFPEKHYCVNTVFLRPSLQT